MQKYIYNVYKTLVFFKNYQKNLYVCAYLCIVYIYNNNNNNNNNTF